MDICTYFHHFCNKLVITGATCCSINVRLVLWIWHITMPVPNLPYSHRFPFGVLQAFRDCIFPNKLTSIVMNHFSKAIYHRDPAYISYCHCWVFINTQGHKGGVIMYISSPLFTQLKHTTCPCWYRMQVVICTGQFTPRGNGAFISIADTIAMS